MPDSDTSRTAGREDILVAATDLFGEAGFDAVSMNTIARRAGVSKANVFHHFGSKDKLYMEVMRGACKLFGRSYEDSAIADHGFKEHLRTLIQRDHELMRDNPDRSHLILREVLECDECQGRALASEVFAGHFDELAALFRDGQAAGVVRSDLPAELAATVMIACNVFLFQSQHVLRHLRGNDFVDDPLRYASLVSDMLLDGLAPRATSTGPESASKGSKI